MNWKWKYLSVLTAVSLTMCAPIFGPSGTTGGTGNFGDSWTIVPVTAGVSNTNPAVYVEIDDLDIAVAANTNYQIRCKIWGTTNAGTIGLQMQIRGPTSPASVFIDRQFYNGAGLTVIGILSTAFNSTLNDDAAAGASGTTPGVLDYNINLENGANAGTVEFAFQPEAAGTASDIYAGSYCEYRTY